MNSFSLLSLFTDGDLAIRLTSMILIVGSVLSWTIIIAKIRLWHRAKKHGLNTGLRPDQIIKSFDDGLWYLSMAATVAPFIGLFGTVWGVMNSFASIGAAQSVSIAVIAPGLAAALGTTVLGLIVAIPSAIAYQYFAKKTDDLYDDLTDGEYETK